MIKLKLDSSKALNAQNTFVPAQAACPASHANITPRPHPRHPLPVAETPEGEDDRGGGGGEKNTPPLFYPGGGRYRGGRDVIKQAGGGAEESRK